MQGVGSERGWRKTSPDARKFFHDDLRFQTKRNDLAFCQRSRNVRSKTIRATLFLFFSNARFIVSDGEITRHN